MPRTKKRSTTATVDFTGVEGRTLIAEGDYALKVTEVTQEEGQAADYFKWKFAVVGGDYDGQPVYYNTSLAPQSLWNLRSLLEAIGVQVPSGPLEIDLDDMVDLMMNGTIEHDKYEGKKQARLVDFWPSEDTEISEEEEEEVAPPKSRRGRPPKILTPAATPAAANGPKNRKKVTKPEPEPEPEEIILSQDEINEMTEEELQEIIDENDLDVDLGEFKTLRKMRAAVIDAGEEAGILG
jgi:hypothetical protein